MPVKFSVGVRSKVISVVPTENWQSFMLLAHEKPVVYPDENFYITLKKVE
jgi:hypothetical protein